MKITRRIVFTNSDCELALRELLRCILIANDIETIPFKKDQLKKYGKAVYVMTINCYTGLTPEGNLVSFCFPFQTAKSADSGAPNAIAAIYKACSVINDSGIPFTGHNYVYDLAWLLRYLLPVRNYAYDSMTMFWSKWPELPKTLDFVASILLDSYRYWKAGRKADDFVEYCDYGMSDTEMTLLATLELIKMMEADSRMRNNFVQAHMRCIAGLAMSLKGMKVNQGVIDVLGAELKAVASEKLERLQYLVADSNFNPNSPKQKSELLYSLLGVRLRNAKGKFVTKIEDASTGAVPLRAMRSDHPIFRRVANGIMEAIEPSKQISNVIGLAHMPAKPGGKPRFLTAYDGTGTTTTRYSSRGSAFGFGGNAQNIRKNYRVFMEADSDSFLLDIDYSAADDVFVSFESGEQKKIDLVRSGKDIHASNALIFFQNWTYDSIIEGKSKHDPRVVHPITGIRQITKKVVHGNHYLMAGLTLLMTAGREAIVAAAVENGFKDGGYWSQAQLIKFCELLESRFRGYYPRLARTGPDSWYNDLRSEVVRNGGFTTIFGYYQRFISDAHEDSTLRAIAATAGQANTAGRINMALNELIFGHRMRRFRDGPAPDADDDAYPVSESEHGISTRLQTHDSLTFNGRFTHPNWRDGVERIFHVMSRPVLCKGEIFKVGIEAEVSYTWAGKEGRVVRGVEDIERWLAETKRK